MGEVSMGGPFLGALSPRAIPGERASGLVSLAPLGTWVVRMGAPW